MLGTWFVFDRFFSGIKHSNFHICSRLIFLVLWNVVDLCAFSTSEVFHKAQYSPEHERGRGLWAQLHSSNHITCFSFNIAVIFNPSFYLLSFHPSRLPSIISSWDALMSGIALFNLWPHEKDIACDAEQLGGSFCDSKTLPRVSPLTWSLFSNFMRKNNSNQLQTDSPKNLRGYKRFWLLESKVERLDVSVRWDLGHDQKNNIPGTTTPSVKLRPLRRLLLLMKRKDVGLFFWRKTMG